MFALLQCTLNWFVYFVLIYNDPDCTFKKSSVVKPDNPADNRSDLNFIFF